MEISKALEPMGIPVCHPPYSGSDDTYVTYQFTGQRSAIYAEGEEAETGASFSVDLYISTEQNAQAMLIQIKKLLSDAGYICTVDMETTEKETRRRHYALTAIREGAIYV